MVCCLYSSAGFACAMDPNSCQQQQLAIQAASDANRASDDAMRAANEAQQQFAADEAAAAGPAPDPMQVHVTGAIASFQLMKSFVDEAAAIKDDPEYQAYMKGKWSFFQDKHKARPGEFCAAFFMRKDNMVMISGPGGGYDGALITFWSKAIPTTKSVRKLKVTLKQTGEAPQTVQALNYKARGHGFAAIALTVPNLKAALAGMLDTHDFELLVGGKSVSKISWWGGNKARDRLKACAAKWKG